MTLMWCYCHINFVTAVPGTEQPLNTCWPKSMPRLLLPRSLKSPGHQQPWYLTVQKTAHCLPWGKTSTTSSISVSSNDTKWNNSFMLSQMHSARQRVIWCCLTLSRSCAVIRALTAAGAAITDSVRCYLLWWVCNYTSVKGRSPCISHTFGRRKRSHPILRSCTFHRYTVRPC